MAQQEQQITRKSLLTASPIDQHVRKVEIREIELPPSRKAGLHIHPCPVVGYIVSGTVSFQVEGGPVQTLKAGDAFFEPANARIPHFDNASDSVPLKFIAYYMVDDAQELIKMIPGH